MVNWTAMLVGAAVGVSFLALVGIAAVLFATKEDDNEKKREEAYNKAFTVVLKTRR